MSRLSLDKILRLRVIGVITKEVHGRDILERLVKTQTMDIQSFEWQMQLRFYWEKNEQNEDCIIRQTMTKFIYNYVLIKTIFLKFMKKKTIQFFNIGIFGLYNSSCYFTTN